MREHSQNGWGHVRADKFQAVINKFNRDKQRLGASASTQTFAPTISKSNSDA